MDFPRVFDKGIAAVRFLYFHFAPPNYAFACTLVLLMTFGFQPLAFARLAEAGDLGSVYESERADVEVDLHGHSKMIVERLIRINNDEGRERESMQFIDFNDRASKLKILVAHTINGKKEIPVSRKNIEVKAVGDFSRFFDVQKKAKITFPNVQIGSKIYLKYELKTNEVPNEGFYSFLADFNWWYMERYQAKIRSRLPLYFWKNDPAGVLEMASSHSGKWYTMEIHSTGPIRLQTTQEENAFIRSERSETFVVSSLESWAQYAGATIVNQEKLFAKPLPPGMEKIREAADSEPTLIQKLDKVASMLSQEYRYFGDWRRRNGGFIPRSLNEIDETHYGDCKDLSLASAAIFRALGLKADIAWTLRGEFHLRPNRDWYKLPVDWFNHAVTRVEAPDGKIYWIDATNPVSFARAVPQDIAGKAAFVLRSEHPFLDTIPELSSDTFQMEKNLVYRYQPDRSLKVEGDLKLNGRAAINLTTNIFYKPIETVHYDLIHALSYGFKILNSFVGDFPRGSRIVSDKALKFGFTLADAGVRTSAGYGFLLMRENGIDRLLEDIRDRASDVAVDTPGTWINREEMTGVKRIGKRSLDCDLKSEWANATRVVSDSSDGIVSTDRLEILKSVIPNEVLHTPEFEKFQNALRECFFRAAIVFEARPQALPKIQAATPTKP